MQVAKDSFLSHRRDLAACVVNAGNVFDAI